MRFIIISLLIISLIAGSSCRRDHYKVNTSSINVNIGIKRLEKDMFSISPEKIAESVPVLREKYSGFLQYFSYVIKAGDINEPSFGDMLVRFCTDRLNNEIYDSVMKVFPEVTEIENGLEDAFRHYIYYFPERKVPSVYTCITGFNYSIIASDSILGISLDRYLGAYSRYYPQLGIYSYISARMTPLNVVPDCMYGWADSEWIFDSTGYAVDNVLSRMIHYGKLKYFEKCMLPDEPDELIFGFTTGQMNFCRNNELQMWQHLIEHDLLFSTEQFEIRKLTEDAPFTSYFTNESPGRAANWIGFRIIESYMMKNPGVKLEELMKETDIQGLLQKAKYSPK